MDIKTIDTENDVLSVLPRQEAHFEEESNEQQRKQTKFNVSKLELESQGKRTVFITIKKPKRASWSPVPLHMCLSS